MATIRGVLSLTMKHLTPIYAVWSGNAEALAADIGESGVTVRQWRNRGNIPPRYWQRIIAAASKKGTILEWGQFVAPDGGASTKKLTKAKKVAPALDGLRA